MKGLIKKLKGMRKVSNDAMKITVDERIHEAKMLGYNKAIQNIISLLESPTAFADVVDVPIIIDCDKCTDKGKCSFHNNMGSGDREWFSCIDILKAKCKWYSCNKQ